MGIFAIFSIALSYMLLYRTSGIVSAFFHFFALFGIMIHEICHVLMCFLTRTRVESVALLSIKRPRNNGGTYGISGKVRVDGTHTTFLKAFLIGFAPLYMLFWLFFFTWDQLYNPDLEYGQVLLGGITIPIT